MIWLFDKFKIKPIETLLFGSKLSSMKKEFFIWIIFNIIIFNIYNRTHKFPALLHIISIY